MVTCGIKSFATWCDRCVDNKVNRMSEVSVFNVCLCPQLWFDSRIQQVGCVIALGVGHWLLTLDTWVAFCSGALFPHANHYFSNAVFSFMIRSLSSGPI
jgi:hypothetical protein